MKTRDEILDEVLGLYSEIEERQERINELYKEAKQIYDPMDDSCRTGFSLLDNIKSYVIS